MILAIILGIPLLTPIFGGRAPAPHMLPRASFHSREQSAPLPQTSKPSSPSLNLDAGQSSPAAPSKPSTAVHRKHKKVASADCSNTAATRPASAAKLPPCPPTKKIVKDGGSKEPAIQLNGDTKDQAWQQKSTEDLTAATNDNLKKVDGHQLNSSQQDMVTQIKQFMEQSKAAIAEGDVQRGHSLAAKANLLSDELVKP